MFADKDDIYRVANGRERYWRGKNLLLRNVGILFLNGFCVRNVFIPDKH